MGSIPTNLEPTSGDVTPNLSSTLKDLKVIIVGAGFAGLACAADIARRGANVTIFESASAVRTAGEFVTTALPQPS